jgi:Zn-dependent protease
MREVARICAHGSKIRYNPQRRLAPASGNPCVSSPFSPGEYPGHQPEPSSPWSPPQFAGAQWPVSAASVPVVNPIVVDPITEAAVQALAQKPPERTWIQSLAILVVSLVIFASAGFLNSTPMDLALLVGVLFFHEFGHYLGMRLFNYQDVKMFFIPFFGAAVSGRSTSVEGYKEAIVLLLGPMPGIVLGVVLGVICMFHPNEMLRSAAMLLLAINAFNLLPLLPLDGGRLVHLIVFSRQRHIEAIFRVVTAVLLGLLALLLGAWLLGIVALFLLLGTRMNYTISKLAQELRGFAGGESPTNVIGEIPRDWALPLIQRVRAAFPAIQPAATLANIARQVWERMHLRPPGLAASVALLAVYAASFFGTPVAAAILFQRR